MISTPLTSETADTILALLKRGPKGGCETRVCSTVLSTHDRSHGKWVHVWEACYAPTVRKLSGAPDHFGIGFFGHKGNCAEADRFIEVLMSPSGPFKDVLPFLYHSTAEEVRQDGGFFVHNAQAMKTPGLLWTFLQAARMPWEHSEVSELFVEAQKHTKHPTVALYMSLALWGQGKERYTTIKNLHGDALGSGMGNPYRLRRGFLKGLISNAFTQHHPYHSWECFQADGPPADYRNPDRYAYTKPLPVWAEEFDKIYEGP